MNNVSSFITGINQDALGWTDLPTGSNNTGLPDELIDGSTAISFSPHRDNWVYNCNVDTASLFGLRTALMEATNWQSNNAMEQSSMMCSFYITPPPTLTSQGGAGLSAYLDGSNDRIQLQSLFNPSTTDFSIELWFEASGTGVEPLIQQRDAGGTGRTLLFVEANQLKTELGGAIHVSSDLVKQGDWNHAALTYDGAELSLYLNGIHQVTDSATAESCSGIFQIGRNKAPTMTT